MTHAADPDRQVPVHPAHKARGFTLVQMAVIVLMLGLFIGSTLSFLTSEDDINHEKITRDRMQKIALALHNYAEQKGSLPCASWENISIGDAADCSGSTQSFQGIVPFKTLGLAQTDIIDGYGNPFTYVVSDAVLDGALSHRVGRNPPMGSSTYTPIQTEAKCRMGSWMSGANLNKAKAVFCCQFARDTADGYASAKTFTVLDDTGARLIPFQDSTVNPVYADPDTLAGSSAAGNLKYFAYALVSHGKNGLGSYRLGISGHKALPSNTGVDEQENGNDNFTFVARGPNTDPANYFDDIVLWRTQDQVMAENGLDSCNGP